MHGDERPEPVTIGWCVQPASSTPLKQPSGDDPRVTIRPVIFLKFFFVNRRAPQLHAVGLAVLGGLDSGDERRLTGAAASALTVPLRSPPR